MNNYCLIRATGLPIINNTNYACIKIIPERLFRDGFSEQTKIYTDKYYKTLEDTTKYSKRLIQATGYERYKLEYYCVEHEVPELLPLFETVTITDQEGVIYDARNITVEKSQVQDTYKYKVVIKFDNCIPYQFAVNNYLDSASIIAKKISYYAIKFETSRTVTGFTSPQYFYTHLEKQLILEPKNVKIEHKQQDFLAQTINFNNYNLVLFLSETDRALFELCAYTADSVSLLTYTNNILTDTIIITEPIKYDIQSNNEFIDLFQIDLTLKTGKYQLDDFLETYYLWENGLGVASLIVSGTIDSEFSSWESEYTGTEVINLKTMFTPSFESPEVKTEDKIELEGLEIPTYQTAANSIIFKVIANIENYNRIMKYLPMASTVILTYGSDTYTALEAVKVEDKKNKELIDLFELEIIIKYNVVNFNPFA